MRVLLTGGAGFIGSHTCVELLAAGHEVVVFDNFSNSRPEVLDRIFEITGKRPMLYSGDVRNPTQIRAALRDSDVSAVLHFAGLKAVGDSVENPLTYYDNNVNGTIQLLKAMEECSIRSLVFSSSATVYGYPQSLPLSEDHPLSATNPYGQTKLVIEVMLRHLASSDQRWKCVSLRYFNPVGAHSSGLIGEDPQGVPNNLMPLIAQVAVGRREYVNILGNDYDTHDGTGIRDYIHVVDLAHGHMLALERMCNMQGYEVFNLGTGVGSSVLDMVAAFEQVCGKSLPYRIAPRRIGDVATCYADATKATTLLGWYAKRNLGAMCEDTWRWQTSNPDGYAKVAML
jgi:UDP-glucose 4-epimerase